MHFQALTRHTWKDLLGKMFFKKGKQILDQASMTHPQVHTSVSSDFLGSLCFLKELKLPNVTKIEANVNFEHFLNI
jgi:hypothetical protein